MGIEVAFHVQGWFTAPSAAPTMRLNRMATQSERTTPSHALARGQGQGPAALNPGRDSLFQLPILKDALISIMDECCRLNINVNKAHIETGYKNRRPARSDQHCC